jgi:hypothetical protein
MQLSKMAQQQRNIRLLILLGVLITITSVAYWMINRNTIGTIDKNLFRVEDFNTINRVTLVKDSQAIELTFDGVRWKVNDRLADRNMIDVLFATLQQAEPKRLLAESVRDSINNILDKEGVVVSLFADDERKLEFTAGGNRGKTQAYFKDVQGESYVMVIPGYRVYTSGVFELDENGWKDRYVFNFNWKNFKSLKTKFPEAKNDFEVAMGDSYFEIEGMTAVDTTRLNDFLDAVSLVEVDYFVSGVSVPGLDSLLKTAPQLEIVVDDISGRNFSLAVYTQPGQQQDIGVIQGTEVAMLGKQKTKNLLKERAWFIKTK